MPERDPVPLSRLTAGSREADAALPSSLKPARLLSFTYPSKRPFLSQSVSRSWRREPPPSEGGDPDPSSPGSAAGCPRLPRATGPAASRPKPRAQGEAEPPAAFQSRPETLRVWDQAPGAGGEQVWKGSSASRAGFAGGKSAGSGSAVGTRNRALPPQHPDTPVSLRNPGLAPLPPRRAKEAAGPDPIAPTELGPSLPPAFSTASNPSPWNRRGQDPTPFCPPPM